MAKYTPLGKRIKIAMIEKDLETRDVTEHCKVTPQYLADILKGARPGKKYVPIICKFLGIDQENQLTQQGR